MLVFDAEQHVYAVDGVKIPSVTGIIASAGALGQSPKFYTPEAADRGTRVHQACAEFDLGVSNPVLREDEQGYLESYKKWLSSVPVAWDSIEQRKYSKIYGFAGTADRVGTVSGKPAVVDLKTGSPCGIAHALQLCFYDLLHDDIPAGRRRRICLYLRSSGRLPQSVEFTSQLDYVLTHQLLTRGIHNNGPDNPTV
jgi:hypothetical protein|tara:strand:+ start:2216 stop:2803 length:588 start_codon:yes stop_codon:yes gene_type:complete